MIILVILLVVFGYSIQAILTKDHKKNMHIQDYKALKVVLYLDTLATLFFIFSVYFEWHIFFKLSFEFLIFLSMGLLLFVTIRLIKSDNIIRKWIVFFIGAIGVLVVILCSNYIGRTVAHIILAITLFSRLLLFNYKSEFVSKYIRRTIYLLFITESVRFIIESFILSDLIYHVFDDIWISAFSSVLRVISIVFLTSVHERMSIDKNLAKTLDNQSAAFLLNQVFEQNPNVVILTELNRHIVYANKQTYTLTGYSQEEIIGGTPSLLKSGLTPKDTYRKLNKALQLGESWSGEFINKKKNGELFTEMSKIVTLFNLDGTPVYHLSIKNDITKEKEYLRQLEYSSSHDDLTGLLRRQVFIQKLESNIGIYHEHNHYFILMDIDEFKFINDNYGHLIGDDILIEFSSVLKEVFDIRSYICRFGGDEFAVYLHDYEPEQVKHLIERLYQILSNRPIESISSEYRLKFSYGFTKIELPVDFSIVYEKSDKNLYEHKATKNNLRR